MITAASPSANTTIEEKYWRKQSLCPVAWRGIYVDPTGRVDNCCISSNNLGNINDHNLEQILSGERSIEIRQMMVDDRTPEGCRICYRGESDDLRSRFLEKFKNDDKSIYDQAQRFELNYLDLRWRNTCNSACVYCNADLSSKFASELGIEIKSDQSAIEKSKKFIADHLHEIKSIYLAGGEPLLIRENRWLLETLKVNGCSPHILVNTNLSQIDNPIFDLLCDFPSVTWMISGEHTGVHYEYIRYGSSWHQFEQNLTALLKINSDKCHEYIFNLVYFALNLQGFWNYLDWVKTVMTKPYQVHPAWIANGNQHLFDPRRLPESMTHEIKSHLRYRCDFGDEIDRPIAEFLLKSWEQPSHHRNGPMSMIDLLSIFDRRRDLDSRHLWPELWGLATEKVHLGNRESRSIPTDIILKSSRKDNESK
jgi:hypothetical protein